MDFLLYEPEDFASDESYLNYYFRLNDADVTSWQNWISNHPEKLDSIINADQLISLLALRLDESELTQEYQRLSLSIQDPPTNVSTTISHPKNVKMRQRIVAGIVLLTVVLMAWLYSSPNKKDLPTFNLTTPLLKGLAKKSNTTRVPSKIQLEDGSIITLQPGSTLNYPHHFSPTKREVYLEGEAFFEVSKYKKSPFYVYCKSLVAHVLGTSFNVKTDDLHGNVEVTVRTGKVEVYEKNIGETKNQNKKSNGLILTPNQRAVYMEDNNQFESSLVDTPLPISYAGEGGKKDSLSFENIYERATPLSTILESLEKTYGIEIETENDNIGSCHFSGDLLDMNLFFKLDAICQAVNATYEVKGTKILIRGRGCN